MKKSMVIILLIIALVLPMSPKASADKTGICFTAVNDNLLELGVMPALINGVPFLPYSVFSYLGINSDYFTADSTLMLYQGDLNIFINLETGEAYDSDGNTYSVTGTYYGSSIYLPVAWVCGYFGLSYSYINGIGYGDILRIKNSNVVLEDKLFIEYAKSLMKTRYDAYLEAKAEKEKPLIPVTPSDGDHLPLHLNFYGLPDEELLDYLSKKDIYATFFVTRGELKDNEDLIINTSVLGHQIGFCPSEGTDFELEEFLKLYFNCLHSAPSFISQTVEDEGNLQRLSAENPLAVYRPLNLVTDNLASIYELKTKGEGESDLSFTLPLRSPKNFQSLVNYLEQEVYTVKLLRETYTTY